MKRKHRIREPAGITPDVVELEFAPRGSTGSLIPLTTPPPAPPWGFWVSELKEGVSLSEIKNTNRGTGFGGNGTSLVWDVMNLRCFWDTIDIPWNNGLMKQEHEREEARK